MALNAGFLLFHREPILAILPFMCPPILFIAFPIQEGDRQRKPFAYLLPSPDVSTLIALTRRVGPHFRFATHAISLSFSDLITLPLYLTRYLLAYTTALLTGALFLSVVTNFPYRPIARGTGGFSMLSLLALKRLLGYSVSRLSFGPQHTSDFCFGGIPLTRLSGVPTKDFHAPSLALRSRSPPFTFLFFPCTCIASRLPLLRWRTFRSHEPARFSRLAACPFPAFKSHPLLRDGGFCVTFHPLL